MMIYPRLRVEVSYSSTLVALWSLTLAALSWSVGLPLQGLTIMLLSSVALTAPHGESRMLFPLLFLGEHMLDKVMSLGHSPLEFYASTILSYLTLVVSRGWRKGNVHSNICLEVILYATVGLLVVFVICKDSVISFGAGAFVLSGFIFFLALRPVLGENEVVLLCSLMGFYICDVVINNSVSGNEALLHAPGYFTTKMHIASRGAVLCAIYLATLLFICSQCCKVARDNNSKSSERVYSVQRITILFWCLLTCTVVVMYVAVSLQFEESAMLWLWRYITSSRYRMTVLISWITFIPLSVACVDVFAKGLRTTARRKLFHFIAVVAFTPVALVDPHFLSLALSLAASIAIIVELARFYRVYGSEQITQFVVRHIDDRDAISGVVRTHIYLIYGLGLSMMLRYRHEQPHSAVLLPRAIDISIIIIPGLLALGIVDACAGIIGSTFLLSHRRTLGRYLNNRFFTERANFSITHKTTTGTLGGLLCGTVFWLFVLFAAGIAEESVMGYTFILILVCSLTECFMDGIDNLQLPVVIDGAAHTLFALLLQSRKFWEQNHSVTQEIEIDRLNGK